MIKNLQSVSKRRTGNPVTRTLGARTRRGGHWLNRLARQRALALFLLSMPLLPANGEDRPPPLELFEQALVRVSVTAAGKRNLATGFVWQDPGRVVTALHAMRGGGEISVECRGSRKRATVDKVYPDADLVLLRLENPAPNCLPLGAPVAANAPATWQSLFTAGYYGDTGNALTRELKKGGSIGGSESLRYILPNHARAEIGRLGIPNQDLAIYYIDGSLLPGFSGAPVLDAAGQLVGIGDGGLEQGAVNVSWIIPASNLEILLRSKQSGIPVTLAKGAAQLFSAEAGLVEIPAEVVWHSFDGSYRFVKTKTRTLRELLATTDDPEGVERAFKLFGGAELGLTYDQIKFEVYEETERGIIVVTPAGVPLELEQWQDQSRHLAAKISDGQGGWSARLDFNPVQPNSTAAYVGLDDPRFFQAELTDYLTGCVEPGYSLCALDEPTLRLIDFRSGSKILKWGVQLRTWSGREPLTYFYNSIAVRHGKGVRVGAQVNSRFSGHFRGFPGRESAQQVCRQDARLCRLARDQFAMLLAAHLSTLSDIVPAAGSGVLETRFVYDDSANHPETWRWLFEYPGSGVFMNTHADQWREFPGKAGSIVTGKKTIYGVKEQGRSDAEVLLDYSVFGGGLIRFPIAGGPLYQSMDQGRSWKQISRVTKSPPP